MKYLISYMIAPIMAPIVIIMTLIFGNKYQPDYSSSEIIISSLKAFVYSIAVYIILIEVML